MSDKEALLPAKSMFYNECYL